MVAKFHTQKWGELSPTLIQNFLVQFLVNGSKKLKITRDKNIFGNSEGLV